MKKFKNLKSFAKTSKWLEQNEEINELKKVIESKDYDGMDEDYFTHLVHFLLGNARNKAVRAAVHRYFYKYLPHQQNDILNNQRWLYLDYYQDQSKESEIFYGKELTFRLKTVLDDNTIEFWDNILN